MFPRSGVIATGSFRCSRTSSATRSSSRRLAVVSRWARPREITRSSSGLRIPAVASRPRACLMSLTDSGKPPGLGVKAPGSGFPSPRASSKLTADESGSRARRAAAPPSCSRFLKQGLWPPIMRCERRSVPGAIGAPDAAGKSETGTRPARPPTPRTPRSLDAARHRSRLRDGECRDSPNR